MSGGVPQTEPQPAVSAQTGSSVAFVILGFGYMGNRALAAIAEVRDVLQTANVAVDLAAIVDINDSVLKEAPALAGQFGFNLATSRTYGGLAELVEDLASIRHTHDRVVLYDATSPERHYGNMVVAATVGLDYLGEKPLVTQPGHLEALGDMGIRAWCNFIETQGRVFRTLAREIANHELKIVSFEFWRYGSTGCKKVFEPGKRESVRGGALLDKAAHDLSIVLGLVGVASLEDWTVRWVSATQFMPAHIFALFAGTPRFMGHDDSWVADLRSGLAEQDDGVGTADAEFHMDMDLVIAGREGSHDVSAKFHFSWIGVPDSGDGLERQMARFGYDRDSWCGHETQVIELAKSTRGAGYMVEEARIGIITAERPTGEEVHLVCNFLGKLQSDPWLESVENNQRTPVELVAAQFGDNSLARVFESVVLEVIGEREADLIGIESARIVHEIILEAQQLAFRGKRDPKHEIERSRGTFGTRLILPDGSEGEVSETVPDDRT